ncbi:copper resistance protein D [Paenibacillus amylolyticus]|uniref:Copper resistance protein D n=1 Tax=Paenibacillus amylolyticus TaxID=1451 RepID=A0A124DYY5_PAEAM|nr:copper resistance protein D [Paenibacillus amylolyticus]
MIRRILDNLYVQHVLFGLIFATVLYVWFPLPFPPNTFWMIVIAWPLIVALWFYAFINGTIPGMNL